MSFGADGVRDTKNSAKSSTRDSREHNHVLLEEIFRLHSCLKRGISDTAVRARWTKSNHIMHNARRLRLLVEREDLIKRSMMKKLFRLTEG
jgi:hypothetical protein